ncbi:MAG: hypothetical protein K2I80_12535 [Ruminococcus sp.]|nr:hypothetical protein [Ruminococcus sp.]
MHKKKYQFTISHLDNFGLSKNYEMEKEPIMLTYLWTKEIQEIHKNQNLSKSESDELLEYEMSSLATGIKYCQIFGLKDDMNLLKYDDEKNIYFYRLSNFIILEIKPDGEGLVFKLKGINKDEWKSY